MRAALAWMLLASAALAQRPEPGVPPGWAVYVVHAPWCAPCQRFRRDYDTISQFRGVLESAFAVKSCDWDRGNDQRFARRFGINSLPGFIVFRDGIHQQSFTGYDGNWRRFLERLNLDISGVDGAAAKTEERGTPPDAARPITPAERALPEIADLRAELDRLRRQMAEAAKQKTSETTAGASPAEKPARPDIPSGTGSPLPTLAIQPPAESGGMAEQWGKVGAAALAIFAPQVALPAGAIGAAATVFQMLRRRRQTMQAQQPRQTIVERPVPVAMPAAPQPAQVVTQNQYVPIDTDTTADAYAWATAQLVKQYPGAEGTVAMLGSLIEQHKAAQSGGQNGHK